MDVNRPPRITIAIGPSISRPGAPAPKASGSSPSAVTSAVMRTGVRRSVAPRNAASTPNCMAEGVEMEEQLVYLHSQDCDLMQGYYFSRPLTAADFEALLVSEIQARDPLAHALA